MPFDIFRLYDLRHTAITWLANHNPPIAAVSERAGHSSIQMTTERYYHKLPGVQKAAVDALDQAFPKPLVGRSSRPWGTSF